MRVACALSGRLRIRLSKKDTIALLSTLVDEADVLPGVIFTKGDSRTGSLLIRYNVELLAGEELLKHITKRYCELKYPLLQKVRVAKIKHLNPLVQKKGKGVSMVLHGGMTISLISVLGSAFFWNKKIHIASGILLTSLVGYHVFLSRKAYASLFNR